MKIIKITKKLNKYFIDMYIDNEVAGATQSTEKPRIEFVKNKNFEWLYRSKQCNFIL